MIQYVYKYTQVDRGTQAHMYIYMKTHKAFKHTQRYTHAYQAHMHTCITHINKIHKHRYTQMHLHIEVHKHKMHIHTHTYAHN